MNGDRCKERAAVNVSHLPARECGVPIVRDVRTVEYSEFAHDNFEPVLSTQCAFREPMIHADGNALRLVQRLGKEPITTRVQTVSKSSVVWKRCQIQQVPRNRIDGLMNRCDLQQVNLLHIAVGVSVFESSVPCILCPYR